jgi:hypothetical protein
MGREPSAMARMTLRLLQEGLIWLPVWLILTLQYGAWGKLGITVAAAVFFLIGTALFKLPAIWSRISVAMVLVLLVGTGLVRYTSDLPTFLWMGAMLWRGRYSVLLPRHYGLGFLVCCAMIIVASQNDLSNSYRLTIIAIALIWVVTWFISLNKGLLEEAGLQNRIVTRPVKLTSRKYLLVFLLVALLIFALTVSYGMQLLTPPAMSSLDDKWIDLSKLETPPPEQPREQEWMVPPEDQGPPSPIWDILFWMMAGVASLAAIWFIRLLWKDRTWSWRSLMESIRRWFLREKRIERLPYVEESRSLTKDKKKGPTLWDTLFHRQGRTRDWEQLNNPEKVRRLYEEVVLSGIEQGYEFRANDTPAETLERIEHWRLNQPIIDKDSQASYWQRLLQMRLALLRLYEQAKYSPHSITEHEVGHLREQIQDRKSSR